MFGRSLHSAALERRKMRSRLLRCRIGVACLAGSLAVVAGSWGSTSSSASIRATGSPIKIGMVLPLTGAISAGFTAQEDTAMARVALANASGGVRGHQISSWSRTTSRRARGPYRGGEPHRQGSCRHSVGRSAVLRWCCTGLRKRARYSYCFPSSE